MEPVDYTDLDTVLNDVNDWRTANDRRQIKMAYLKLLFRTNCFPGAVQGSRNVWCVRRAEWERHLEDETWHLVLEAERLHGHAESVGSQQRNDGIYKDRAKVRKGATPKRPFLPATFYRRVDRSFHREHVRTVGILEVRGRARHPPAPMKMRKYHEPLRRIFAAVILMKGWRCVAYWESVPRNRLIDRF